jgi:hypothetical protein
MLTLVLTVTIITATAVDIGAANSLQSKIGINTHLYSWVNNPYSEYEAHIKDFGIIRDGAWWKSLENENLVGAYWNEAKWTYEWAQETLCKEVIYSAGYDTLVKRFQHDDSPELLLLLDIENENIAKVKNIDAEQVELFYDYVYHVVERYDGDNIEDMPGLERAVKYYEIGNEPEYLWYIDNAYLTPENYVKYRLIPGYKAVKDACSECVVMNAGLGMQGDGTGNNVGHFTTEYLEKMYDAIIDYNKKNCGDPSANNFYMDRVAIHYYSGENKLSENIDCVRKIIHDKEGNSKPIWITEFGFQTEKECKDGVFSGVFFREEDQASLLIRFLALMLAEQIEKPIIYNLKDINGSNLECGERMGLYKPSCQELDVETISPKISLIAYNTMMTTLEGLNFEKMEPVTTSGTETGDLYKISFSNSNKKVAILWFSKNDGTYLKDSVDWATERTTVRIPINSSSIRLLGMDGTSLTPTIVNDEVILEVGERPIYLIEEKPEFYLLSGTLTNADGDPVAGWVYARETTGANLGNQVDTSNGSYEMALFPGTYRVHARVYYSYPSGSYYISTPSQTITISANATLDIQVPSYELYHLTGKVTDTNGVGLANISLQAYDSAGTCQSYTTTDDNGSYDALLIGGTYTLYFRPPQDSIFLEKSVNNVPIYSDTTQNISLNSSEHRLSGALTYADGSPAQGYVYANEVNGATYRYAWSSDGTYQMALVPGNYRVYALAYTFYSPGYTRITTPYQTVTVSGDTHHNIDVPSHDLYHLTGKVTDINDIIQPNVTIDAYDSGGICYGHTTTAADGSYELMLIPGTYSLRISAPPATYPPFEIKKLTIAGDSVRNIRLSLEYSLLEEALSLLPDDLDIALDVFDIIDQADVLNYDISVQGAKGLLQIILNWAGSEMKVTLYDPNGNVYGEYQSTEPPVNVEIPNPTEGVWKCEVTAVDVPHDNYPFALVAGISPNESPVADANGPYSGAVDSPITFDASGSYDPDGNIVSYEWDWDGDGNFDESSDSDTITHTWIKPYSGAIVLRVKDNEGATSTDSAYVEVGAGSLLAEIDINPDVLNPKSKGNWITCYIELQDSYSSENIDVSTVTLEGTIPAESSPTQVGDHDDDGIPDLMVKFDRQALIGYLGGATGEVTLTLTGDVDGKPFEGSDTITVIGQEKE